MAFASKISAAAAAAFVFAGAASASVAGTAVSHGTAPSTWIVLISGLAMAGLAVGGSRRSARSAGQTGGSAEGRRLVGCRASAPAAADSSV
ncbi:MAG: hypothetical protein KGZ61_10095 [Sandarakinorhabdus sp.]|nr:hypothetical protein [Sandarakinorhabdus sp.]